jgi:hypothetical protein
MSKWTRNEIGPGRYRFYEGPNGDARFDVVAPVHGKVMPADRHALLKEVQRIESAFDIIHKIEVVLKGIK